MVTADASMPACDPRKGYDPRNMSLRKSVLSSYRGLLRPANTTFKNDVAALSAARLQLRASYEEHRQVMDAGQIEELVAGAREAEDFLTNHVAQAQLTSEGNYAVSLDDQNSVETAEGRQQTVQAITPELTEGPGVTVHSSKK